MKEPTAARGEVVLQVLCAGLNHLDIWVRNGRPGSQLQMPHVLGSDAVGVVVAVGEGVEGPKVGEQVIVYPGLNCGRCEFCRRGEQSLCTSFGIVGLVRPGTFAERVAVPAANCYPKPAHLSDEQAAVLALAHVTAWRMLLTRARVKPGETLLIHGIGGGVAVAALQFAKLTGVEVLVTSSSDEKLSRAKQLGADHTINYTNQNIAGEFVGSQTVAGSMWSSTPSERRRGRWISPVSARMGGLSCAVSRRARRPRRTYGLSTESA